MQHRNQAIETLRIVAALFVVIFHSGVAGTSFGGMSAFIAITMLFEAGALYTRPAAIGTLSIKLLIPWAFWFAVYALLSLVFGHPRYLPHSNFVQWILVGPAWHLWYLPFLYAVLVAFRLARQFIEQQTMRTIATTATLVMIATMSFWRPAAEAAAPPVEQYLGALPAVLVGIVIGTSIGDRSGRAIFLSVGGLIAASILGSGTLAPAAISGVLLIACLHLGPLLPPRFDVQWLSSRMLGVYLIHPLFLHALYQPLSGYGLLYPLAAFAASIAVTVGFHWVRARTPLVSIPSPL